MADLPERPVRRGAEPAFAHPPWVSVYLDELDGGSGGTFVRIVESDGRAGVAVLPLRGDQIGMVWVFRPAVGEWCLEIPRGFGESDDPRDDAARELAEETGVRVAPADLVPLGLMQANTGLLATPVHLFLAPVGDGADQVPADQAEVASVEWTPVTELFAAARDGRVHDGFTQAAMLRASLAGLLPQADGLCR
jgi:ADP-ribose pyrophosphatase